MACNRYRLFLVLSAALLLLRGGAAAARTAALLGGWSPIENISDPHVQAIGKFAMTEHNRQAATNLKFQSVVSGNSQVVSGVNYRLVVAAVDGGVSNKYEAVVWEKTWVGFKSLVSFRRVQMVDVGVAFGDFEDVFSGLLWLLCRLTENQ